MAGLENPLKAKLAAGEAVLGTMTTMPSIGLAQLLTTTGFD